MRPPSCFQYLHRLGDSAGNHAEVERQPYCVGAAFERTGCVLKAFKQSPPTSVLHSHLKVLTKSRITCWKKLRGKTTLSIFFSSDFWGVKGRRGPVIFFSCCSVRDNLLRGTDSISPLIEALNTIKVLTLWQLHPRVR